MQLTVLLLIVIIAIALAKQMPAPKMRAPNMEKSALMQNKVLSIRGGGVVSKDFFVKFFAYSMAGFGLQFLAIPKMFWEMNFADAFNKEAGFLGRMLGLMILTSSYLMTQVDTELAYKIAAVESVVIAYMGPYTATQTFKTKPAHKLPEILMPAIIALAAAAY